MPKAYKPLPSAAELWELFDYKPLTGELVRKATGRRTKLGRFGSVSSKGYRFGMLKGSCYYAHRLVWAWVTGSDPETEEVDHIDRNRDNNAWHNLRLVKPSEQAQNTKTYKNNKLGIKGVKLQPDGKYMARIRVNYKLLYLGVYDTAEEAHAAYLSAKTEHHIL